MPEISGTGRADKLREEIAALKSQQYAWGIENSFYMLALKFLGTAFAGAAAIAAVFRDVDRAWTAALSLYQAHSFCCSSNYAFRIAPTLTFIIPTILLAC